MTRSYLLNVKLLCLFKALQMALFPLAIITVFWKDHIGMSITDVMIVQATLALTIVLAEFPSGFLADRFGYRATLILSALLSTVGWSFYLFADQFWHVMVAEILYGSSLALVSGTDQSLMYESLSEANENINYPKWSGRMQAYIMNIRYPFALEVVICIVNIAVAILLLEPNRLKPSFGKTMQQIKEMLVHVLIVKPRLRDLMILTLFLGLSTFIPVWLIQLYAKNAGASLQTLSMNWAVANLVVAFGAFVSYRVGRKVGFTNSIILCIVLLAIGYLGLGLNYMTYGFTFYYLLTFMRGLNGPILMNEKQLLVTSENRAGMLSLQSLLFRAVFIVVGPTIGFFIDFTDMHTVFLTLAVILTILAIISLTILNRKSV